MKLPGLAACMLAAAALLPWLDFSSPLVMAGVAGLSALILFRQTRSPAVVFLLCLLWVFWRGSPGPTDLRRQLSPETRSVRLRFQVRGDQTRIEKEDGSAEIWVPVRVNEVYLAGQWQDAAGRLQLRLPALEAPDFRIGSNWETYGVLRPGNHSYVGLFRAQGVLRPDPGALQSIAGNPAGWMLSSIFGVREKLAAGIDRACGGDARISGTLQALLLGRRNEMDRETLQMFVRTGLVHIFAVSGLHLGLLCGILLFFGRWMGISPRWIPLWVLPLLILFTLYTGLRASALRALVMIAVLLCSMPLYRRAKIENAFALAVILILGTAPAQIYDLGFQYSFLLVGSLLAFGTFFSDQVRAWFAPDPWAPLDPFRQFRHQVLWPRVQGALVVSLLCFMVSAPLTARVFHLFSPVGVLGNLLAVPLVFLLLATGFPALLFVGFPAEFSAALFLPARWSAALLLQWVDFLETLPGGTQWVKAPPLWMLFAFYAGLFALWRWPEKRKWAVGFLLGLGVYAAAGAWMDFRRPTLGVMETDRGQSVWFRLPGEGIVLVDSGSAWSGDQVVRTLQAQGVDRIAGLLLTHPDRNHIGGAAQVLRWMPPERIGVAAADLSHPLYESLNPPLFSLSGGETFECGGWTVEVLHPPETQTGGAADRRSLVLRFSRGFISVLVMGGAGAAVEKELVDRGQVPRSRLILAGNPREEDLILPEFLRRVQPEAVLYAGQGFTGISPEREASELRTLEAGVRVLRVEGRSVWLLNPLNGSFQISRKDLRKIQSF